ncbi:MAG: hypothetical protein FWD59_10370, partial [Micrococcales bacterium]|nr:hypothetical protein [Micrococcales bacterium]
MAASAGPPEDQLMNLAQYVNPLIGTAWQSASGYQGNVAPGAQVPHGMVNFGPDMNRPSYNGSGGYTTSTNANPTTIPVNFFSVTHLNGPGCPGAGVVGMMAGTTSRAVANQAASITTGNGAGGVPTTPVLSYTPAQETVQLGYFATTVNNAKHEFTSTARTGVARFTYPNK